MESNHDEIPMSITNVPSNPCRGVCVEDQRQQDHIGNPHDGAGQYHHQTNKHLSDKDGGHQQRAAFRENRTEKLPLTTESTHANTHSPCQTIG